MSPHTARLRPRRSSPSAAIAAVLAALCASAASPAFGRAPASSPPVAAPPPADAAQASAAGAPVPFTPLDLPEWVIRDAAAPKDQPWVVIVDDPQCPYCMQLHLALEKAREQGDPEVTRSVTATMPFPLTFHDQAAHVTEDVFCMEASGKERGWSAASYLDWLIVAPWRAEPDWKGATIEDLEKDGGLFDTRYDAHKILSSRRRDFQTERARAEAACGEGACRGDADCEKLCAAQKTCREACPPDGGAEAGKAGAGQAAAGAAVPPSPSLSPAGAPPTRERCLASCADKFVSARYRQYSKVHSACLLEEGPSSAHGKTAAAFAWAMAHKVPGTPTVYVGHPAIGFRLLGDSDNLAEFFVLLRQALSEARAKLAPPPAAR